MSLIGDFVCNDRPPRGQWQCHILVITINFCFSQIVKIVEEEKWNRIVESECREMRQPLPPFIDEVADSCCMDEDVLKDGNDVDDVSM